MTTPAVHVPRRLQKLGNALEPIRDLLREGLWEYPSDPATREASADDLPRHVQHIIDFTNEVVELLQDDLLPLLEQKGDPGDYQALSKGLKRIVRRQLKRYIALEADPAPSLVTYQLTKAYRHNLEELLQWLDDFVELVQFPSLYHRPEELPHATLSLEFTPAPELDELIARADDHAASSRKHHCSFWETVGAVTLGIVIADLLLPDRET